MRNGAGGARGVIWAKYPVGKNRCHTYTYVSKYLHTYLFSEVEFRYCIDPSRPLARRRSGAALPNTRATRLSLRSWAIWACPLAERFNGRYGRAY